MPGIQFQYNLCWNMYSEIWEPSVSVLSASQAEVQSTSRSPPHVQLYTPPCQQNLFWRKSLFGVKLVSKPACTVLWIVQTSWAGGQLMFLQKRGFKRTQRALCCSGFTQILWSMQQWFLYVKDSFYITFDCVWSSRYSPSPQLDHHPLS